MYQWFLKLIKLFKPHKILIQIAFCIWIIFSQEAFAGKCTGSVNCKACTTCNYCKYCHVNGGVCSVCDSSVANSKGYATKSSFLSKGVGRVAVGAGILGGLYLLYNRKRKKKE